MVALLLLLVLFVAYSNGANDNFKGVATLFGSGTTNYRRALTWATLTTLAGSLTALFISDELVKVFSGKGLVPDEVVGTSVFVLAVALGAGATVFTATLLSFPISTTHALTGSLIGAGLVLAGGVDLSVLGGGFFLPLLMSPVLALAVTAMIYPPLRWMRRRSGMKKESSVRITAATVPAGDGTLTEQAVAVGAGGVLNGAHYLSAGAVSFARGLNDTPKIVGLLLAARAMDVRYGLVLVGFAMALGAVLHARKVAETMSKEITEMNAGQGFAANIVTSVLVIGATRLGVPVSTTHVSCGSLFGLGAVTRKGKWKTVGKVLLAWVVTLPMAGAVAAGAAAIL